MTRRIIFVVCLLAFAGVVLAAPNFSGDWKINASKSKTSGQFPLPAKFDRKIAHAEPALQVTTTRSGFQGREDFTTEAKYTTDGKETTNPGFGGSQMKSVAKWEGDVLAIQSSASTANGDFTVTERWSLSSDGKTLEIRSKVVGGFGEFESTYVLDKQ